MQPAHNRHFRRGVLAFAASLTGLPNEVSDLGGAFSCFGLRCSRFLRFCPLAIAKRPFDESGAARGLEDIDGLQVILGRHPLMAFAIVANAVLKRVVTWWQRAGDAIELCSFWRHAEARLQADDLSDIEQMGRYLI